MFAAAATTRPAMRALIENRSRGAAHGRACQRITQRNG
ncbi:MAG: hypothetical protein ACJAVR_003189 [Paracoccaceae bacterium]|jgi:hypothetical protein